MKLQVSDDVRLLKCAQKELYCHKCGTTQTPNWYYCEVTGNVYCYECEHKVTTGNEGDMLCSRNTKEHTHWFVPTSGVVIE